MASSPLDAVDRGILYHLQQDAQQPLTNIASALNVADNTVRNRIEKLENEGVIQGYTIDVDYGRAGIQHNYVFICTTRVSDREGHVQQVRTIPGVTEVTSVMTGQQNIFVKAAASTKEDITEIAYQLDELGLLIEREHLIWDHFKEPYAGFRLEDNFGQS